MVLNHTAIAIPAAGDGAVSADTHVVLEAEAVCVDGSFARLDITDRQKGHSV